MAHLVLKLRTLLLAPDADACWNVLQAHAGSHLVDVLAACMHTGSRQHHQISHAHVATRNEGALQRTCAARADHGHLQIRLGYDHIICPLACALQRTGSAPDHCRCRSRDHADLYEWLHCHHACTRRRYTPRDSIRNPGPCRAPSSGMTSTAAKLVWRAALALKGDWRTCASASVA